MIPSSEELRAPDRAGERSNRARGSSGGRGRAKSGSAAWRRSQIDGLASSVNQGLAGHCLYPRATETRTPLNVSSLAPEGCGYVDGFNEVGKPSLLVLVVRLARAESVLKKNPREDPDGTQGTH